MREQLENEPPMIFNALTEMSPRLKGFGTMRARGCAQSAPVVS